MDLWAYIHGVKIDLSCPGKPTDNPYVAHCTSLDDCGKIRIEAARSWRRTAETMDEGEDGCELAD